MMYARDFRHKAAESLRGHWGIAVGVGLLASLLGGTSAGGGGGGGGNSDSSGTSSDWTLMDLDGIIPTEYQIPFLTFMASLMFVLVVITLIHFVVGGAVQLGYARFNLNLIDQKPVAVANLFSEFNRFGTAFSLRLLTTIYTVLWSLLFVIPGILAAYSYSMAHFILLENPDMTANDAIRESKELMYGNRWRLFCLEFSFIGWSFVCMFLTLGIGYLWLFPYMEASYAAFYREIYEEKYGKKEQETTYDNYYNGESYTV